MTRTTAFAASAMLLIHAAPVQASPLLYGPDGPFMEATARRTALGDAPEILRRAGVIARDDRDEMRRELARPSPLRISASLAPVVAREMARSPGCGHGLRLRTYDVTRASFAGYVAGSRMDERWTVVVRGRADREGCGETAFAYSIDMTVTRAGTRSAMVDGFRLSETTPTPKPEDDASPR